MERNVLHQSIWSLRIEVLAFIGGPFEL
jgi:hypothetical protein